jgi:hypothetical protein
MFFKKFKSKDIGGEDRRAGSCAAAIGKISSLIVPSVPEDDAEVDARGSGLSAQMDAHGIDSLLPFFC